jgi:5-methylcytosine-specific restriction endonuclease McrA
MPRAKPRPKVATGPAAPAKLRWSGEWVRTRRRILARDGYVCQLQWPGCEGAATHVDHIVPRRFGGEDVDANLRAACRSCNQHRGDGTAAPPDPPVSVW